MESFCGKQYLNHAMNSQLIHYWTLTGPRWCNLNHSIEDIFVYLGLLTCLMVNLYANLKPFAALEVVLLGAQVRLP